MSFAEPINEHHEWIGLPEAARRLGVHRTAVNSMILDGRLQGERRGPYWRVRLDEFERFASRYTRPANVPVPTRDPQALPPVAERALSWLARWGTATTGELREVMSDDPGNIRKATDILRRRGLATRDETGVWTISQDGREVAKARALTLTD